MFVCHQCGFERDEWLLHSDWGGKKRCKVCDAFRSHKRKANPLPFVRFAVEWLHLQYDKALVASGFKRCTQCSQVKPFERDHFGSSTSWCRPCQNEAKRQRQTPEMRQQERRRAAEKAGKVYVPGGLSARAAFDNALRMSAHVTEYRKAQARAKAKEQRIAARMAAAAEKPWTAPGLTDAEAFRIRYRHDPEFQIKERLRRQMNKKRKRDDVADMVRSALKRNGNSPTAERMLGYSLADLKAHIERQFTNGMTLARFLSGEIHIDHIIPQASFDLSIPDEWKRCWCLSNLRPLWAKDNWQKSARIECLI